LQVVVLEPKSRTAAMGCGTTFAQRAHRVRQWREQTPDHPSRKRLMNPTPSGREIKPETPPVESPDVLGMQTTAKSSVDGMGIALAMALLAACSINLTLLCAWL
jgi:hypothetical protein